MRDYVIQLWVITFDQEADRTYVYIDKEKVFASVEGVIRDSLDGHPVDDMVQDVVSQLAQRMDNDELFIPLIIRDTAITVRRLDLDRHNPLVDCLLRCYSMIGSGDYSDKAVAMGRIRSLFTDPAVVS